MPSPPLQGEGQGADHRFARSGAGGGIQPLAQGESARHRLQRGLLDLHEQGGRPGREGVAAAVILRQTPLKAGGLQRMAPGLPGLQQPAAGQPARQAGARRGLPLIVAETADGEGITGRLGEVGGLHVGGQPEAELIDKGLAWVERSLLQHPGLQLDGGDGRGWHQAAALGARRKGDGRCLLLPQRQSRHLLLCVVQQVQGDLPAGQVLLRGGDPAHGHLAHRKAAQQGGDGEFIALALAVRFDDQQPVAAIGTRQQLGPGRGGKELRRQQPEQQKAERMARGKEARHQGSSPLVGRRPLSASCSRLR